MTDHELTRLVDKLRSQTVETTWLEFKLSRYTPQKLGEYISGLSNAASLADVQRGYLVYGIDDQTHEVMGTKFNPLTSKKGNQDLVFWLTAGLNPQIGLEIYSFMYSEGKRVSIFEISPATGQPVSFRGKKMIRINTTLTNLDRHPDKEQAIWVKKRDWTAEICSGATIDDLDNEALEKARKEFGSKHQKLAPFVTSWSTEIFLKKAKLLKHDGITNAAILLLGKPESAVLLSPSLARISWILKDSRNIEMDYEHFGPPFLLATDHVLNRIRNLTIRTMPSGTLFPEEISMYDQWVIREALHNCIAHQDYSLQGRISAVEFPDKLIFTNVGTFLPGSVETVIEQDSPPAIYRNPLLADAMVSLNMIDTQGGGIKFMFQTQWERAFPLPDYDLSEYQRVAVSISGRILDERYTALLSKNLGLTLSKVILLDQIQKRKRIGKQDYKLLKKDQLVEGRYPNLIIASVVAKATEKKGQHIKDLGLEREYYLTIIEKLIRRHSPVARKDVRELILSKLPEVLSKKQKENYISRLLQHLRKSNRIVNQGSRGNPEWVIFNSSEKEKKN